MRSPKLLTLGESQNIFLSKENKNAFKFFFSVLNLLAELLTVEILQEGLSQ